MRGRPRPRPIYPHPLPAFLPSTNCSSLSRSRGSLTVRPHQRHRPSYRRVRLDREGWIGKRSPRLSCVGISKLEHFLRTNAILLLIVFPSSRSTYLSLRFRQETIFAIEISFNYLLNTYTFLVFWRTTLLVYRVAIWWMPVNTKSCFSISRSILLLRNLWHFCEVCCERERCKGVGW